MDGEITKIAGRDRIVQEVRCAFDGGRSSQSRERRQHGTWCAQHFDLQASDIDVKMERFPKRWQVAAGFVAASHEAMTYLRHHVRGYIFKCAWPAGWTLRSPHWTSLKKNRSVSPLKLQSNQRYYLSGLKALGFDTARSETPIVPVITGTTDIALEMTRICRSDGLRWWFQSAIPPCRWTHPGSGHVFLRHTQSKTSTFALRVLARAGEQLGPTELRFRVGKYWIGIGRGARFLGVPTHKCCPYLAKLATEISVVSHDLFADLQIPPPSPAADEQSETACAFGFNDLHVFIIP